MFIPLVYNRFCSPTSKNVHTFCLPIEIVYKREKEMQYTCDPGKEKYRKLTFNRKITSKICYVGIILYFKVTQYFLLFSITKIEKVFILI